MTSLSTPAPPRAAAPPTPVVPQLIRDELVLDQRTVDELKLPPERSEVIIVARKLLLAGAAFVDKDVTIFADEIRPATDEARDGIRLQVTGEAGLNQTGDPGATLTIWCRTLGEVGGRSTGGRGGPGLTGDKGKDAFCPPPKPPFTKPGQQQIDGEQGKQGKPGAKGGPGGGIEINVVGVGLDGIARPTPAQDWLGVGGAGGTGGEGGPGGLGCPTAKRAAQGVKGGTLGKGDDIRGVVRPITETRYLEEVDARIVGFLWGLVRYQKAEQLSRQGQTDLAALELTAAGRLMPPGDQAADIERRMRHALTPAGVERDVNLVPAIGKHRVDWASAAARYQKVALPGGSSVFAAMNRDQLVNGHGQLKADHAELIATDFQQQGSDRNGRHEDLTAARTRVASLIISCKKRLLDLLIDLEVPPEIGIPGLPTLSAAVIRDRIVDVLGDPDGVAPDDRRLVAADPDLLAPGSANDGFLVPGSAALAGLRSSAVGLVGVDPNPLPPGAADWSKPGVVVSFDAVRRELRAATGDGRLLLELHALVELAQRSRLLQLRELQTEQGALVQLQLEERARTTANILASPITGSFSTGLVAVRYLLVLRDFADVLAWRAHAAERSVTLYTLDSTRAGVLHPESAVPPTVHAASFLHGPDQSDQLVTGIGNPGPFLDFIVKGMDEEDASGRLVEYKARGTFVEGRGDSGVDHLSFDTEQHPALIDRLATIRDVWFDATLDDLSDGRFESKVVGVGFTFEGLTADIAGSPVRELTLLVEHSGVSRQRRLDGKIIPQYLLPREVEVKIKQHFDEPTGTFSDVWTGFMRYDDTPAAPNPDQPGQTVTREHEFPLWGRGAAGGWRLRFADPAAPELSVLRLFELEVEYDSFITPGTVSLRRIDQPLGALVPGRTVQARAVLTGPAPAGGLKITVASDNPAVLKVPGAVTVPAGQDRVDIPVSVLTAAGASPVRLRATSPDGFSRRALAFVPAPSPSLPPPVSRLIVREAGEAHGTVNGLAFDGDRLLATYHASTIDPDGTVRPSGPGSMLGLTTGPAGMTGLQRFGVGSRPRSIAVGIGKAYLVNGDPQAFGLSIVDLTTNKELTRTPIGFGPTEVAVDAPANLVYVSNPGQRSVEVFDGSTGARLTSITGIRGPQGIAVDPKRRRIYVAAGFRSNGPDDIENGLAVITRSSSGAHVLDRIIPLEGQNGPTDVAFDLSIGLVHVANIGIAGLHLPGITVIRASDLKVLTHIPVPGPLTCLDVHQATGTVYTGGPATAVHVIDGRARRYVASHPVTTVVQSIVVHQSSGAVFAGDRQTGEIVRLAAVPVTPTSWR